MSATLLPMGSEPVVLALVTLKPEWFWPAVWVATAGNTLGGAVSYSIAAVFGRRFGRKDMSPISVAAGQVTMAAVLLLPFFLIVDQPWTLRFPTLEGMGADGMVWNEQTMAEFLADPRGYVKGTKMSFNGLRKQEAISAVVEYLKSHSQ